MVAKGVHSVCNRTTVLDMPDSLVRFAFMRAIACTILVSTFLIGGCSTAPKSPAIADNVRKSLNQAGLRDVSVSQDRDKGVLTLGGHVTSDADKANAANIAKSVAGGDVVANEIAILPAKDTGATKTMYADLDKGIGNNLDAALVGAGYKTGIRHTVKEGVVILTGTVDDDNQRSQIETAARNVPNVQQVVNEIQTRHQRATSSN